jgi:hypothetical protein
MLAGFIAEAYRRGLTPGVLEDRGHAVAAGRAHDRRGDRRTPGVPADHPGKAADLSTIDRWFAACAASRTASGFAIGRRSSGSRQRRFYRVR